MYFLGYNGCFVVHFKDRDYNPAAHQIVIVFNSAADVTALESKVRTSCICVCANSC